MNPEEDRDLPKHKHDDRDATEPTPEEEEAARLGDFA